MNNRRFSRLLAAPMILWAAVFVLFSMGYMLVLSFSRRGELTGVVFEFTLNNYRNLASASNLNVFWKSLKLALATTLCCTLVGYPFGYYMAMLPKRNRSVVLLLVMVPFWTNALIRIYGWRILLQSQGPIDAALKATGLFAKTPKMLYTDGAVLLGMIYALLPFMILPVYSSCEKLDLSFAEASRDLGAGPVRTFFSITVPLTISGLIAGCVLVFIPSMGLFFLNDILGGSKSVLAGGLIQQLINSRDLPMAAAVSVVLLLFTGLILFLYRKIPGAENSEFL